MLGRRGLKLDAVLELRVPEDVLIERLMSRGRADDTEEVIRNRFRVYRDETAPLLSYYENEHELRTVDAVGGLDEVFERALHLLNH
jgi:adenylate kinase